MSLTHTQALPALMRITEEHLRSRVGAGALKKAHQALTLGNITDIEWLSPTLLSGRVRMAGISPRAQIRFRDDTFTTQCACLLAGECEHVAALILATQKLTQTDTAYSQSWDQILQDIIGLSENGGEPLALHLEYSPHAQDIWLTPLRPGNARPWVRKRAGWADLTSVQWGSVTDTLRTTHLGILRQIYRISRENTTWHSPGELTLSSLGEQAFTLLQRAQEAGIILFSDTHEWEHVRLEPYGQPIYLHEEITPEGITLHPIHDTKTTAGDHTAPHTIIGTIDVHESGRLLRENSPSAHLDTFLSHGSVHIPSTDIARYLSEYAPELRARYPHAPHTSTSAQIAPTHRDTDESTHPNLDNMTLVGRLEPRHNGRDIRISWWAQYEHNGHTSLARLSGKNNALRRGQAHLGLIQRWEELNTTVSRLHLPDHLWPQAHDAWTLHHWDFPAHYLSAFEHNIIEKITIDGLEWDRDALEGHINIIDEPTYINARIRPATTQLDWFNLSATIRVGDVEVPLPEALRAIAAGEDYLYTQGQWVRLDTERIEALRDALEQAGSLSPDQRHPQLSGWHAHLWHQINNLADQSEADEKWAERIAKLPANGQLRALALVESHTVRLRPYQLEGHHWLTSLMRAELGGILADDMGLGKTLQMLSAIASVKNFYARQSHPMSPILVVAPTSVVSTWVHEAQRWYPHLRVKAIKTTSKTRSTTVEEVSAHSDVIVTTYSVVRLDSEEFAQVNWSGCVLDEAHIAKNPRTALYRAIRSLKRQWMIALTGTPVENSWADLWALMSLTSPGLLPGWQRFRERFVTPIEKGTNPRMLTILREAIAPFMLRRSKEAVATDLPEKTETILSVPLDKTARHFYDRLLTQERARILGLLASEQSRHVEVLSAMTRLRQAAIDPALLDESHAATDSAKTQALIDVLDQIIPTGHQALVFSQFTSYLDRLEQALATANISTVRLDGTTRDRDRVIERFQQGEASVFLISLKAGGTGLTLTEADYVFVMDPWWNPAAEAQAIDRAHRIGQDKPVTVYRLVSEDTIEEKVLELQEKKRALVDMLVTEDSGTQGRISVEDIRTLIS